MPKKGKAETTGKVGKPGKTGKVDAGKAGDLIWQGTAANDFIAPVDVDADGTIVDGADGLDDIIAGFGGDDSIQAGSGDDIVYGDNIFNEIGDEGKASSDGVPGNDTIDGGAGNDTIYGGGGDDSILGNIGNDLLYGDQPGGVGDGTGTEGSSGIEEAGKSSSGKSGKSGIEESGKTTGGKSDQPGGFEGYGNDTLIGGVGDDTAIGGGGNDSIDGGVGDDLLYGDNGFDLGASDPGGDDTILGGDGSDTIFGGGEDDLIDGGSDGDLIYGDSGSGGGSEGKSGVEEPGSGKTSSGKSGKSGIEEAGKTTDGDNNGANIPGDDTIFGGDGDDTIFGQVGDDDIFGGAGDDLIYGDDLLADSPGGSSGSGNEGKSGIEEAGKTTSGKATPSGKLGKSGLEESGKTGDTSGKSAAADDFDDYIEGGTGSDTIFGGADEDTIKGGEGADVLYGDYTDARGGGDPGRIGNDTFLVDEEGDGYGDTIFGGGPTDGTPGDFITDNDTLDITGSIPPGGSVEIVKVPDSDGNGFDGTVTWLNADGSPAGTLTFENIETFIGFPEEGDPDAVDDVNSGNEDTPITGNVLDNDSDPDGDPITVTDFTQPENGTVTVNPDGTYEYIPDPDFVGTDTFTYTIDDGNGGTDEATVTITVDPVNDAPDAVNDTGSGAAGQPIMGNVLGNDTDPDGDPLTVVDFTQPDNGMVTVNPDGTYTYTPDPGYNGTDSFTYTIEDPDGGTDTATVTLAVGKVASDPIWEGNSTDDVIEVGDIDHDGTFVDGPDGDEDTIVGYGGNDDITGGEGDDVIFGDDVTEPISAPDAPGDGKIGIPGDDTIDAGAGNDRVLGGDGDDVIDGGIGDDTLFGEDGDDSIDGGLGRDSLIGGEGDDTLDGGDNRDTIDAGEGDDVVDGGDGRDSIDGGDGSDTIDGGSGRDTIDGGAGGDSIDGGDNRDEILGNEGNDTIDGGDGSDLIYGDETPEEMLAGKSISTEPGEFDDSLDGGQGGDTIFGGADDDTIRGGEGADVIYGDYVQAGLGGKVGQIGNDTIIIDQIGDGYGDTVYGGGPGKATTSSGKTGSGKTGKTGKTGKAGKEDDCDTLDLRGSFNNNITIEIDKTTDSDGNGFDGTVTWLDSSGNVLGTLDFFNIEKFIPCLVEGTLVETDKGPVAVQDLSEGDMIRTADNGFKPLLWVGSRTVEGTGENAPVRFKAGTLDAEKDLRVSPLHRMIVDGPEVGLYFDTEEVLVPAKFLTNGDTVYSDPCGEVTYYHIMFETHEVVFANGARTESFNPGLQGIGAFAEETRAEILRLFPELEGFATDKGVMPYTARPIAKKHEARLLRV